MNANIPAIAPITRPASACGPPIAAPVAITAVLVLGLVDVVLVRPKDRDGRVEGGGGKVIVTVGGGGRLRLTLLHKPNKYVNYGL